jgi:hypothetical protein
MSQSVIRAFAATVLVAAAYSAAVAADAGRSPELTALVGEDAGLCVELSGLAGHSRRFVNSEMFRRLQKLPAVRKFLQSKDFQGIQTMRKHLEKLAGRPLESLVADLFGRSVVLAVYPRRDGPPAGVLLTKTAGEKSLADAIKLIERAEPGHVAETIKYEGAEYQRRTRPAKAGRPERTLFYARLGEVFVLTDRESMIRKVVRLSRFDAKSSPEKPLSRSPNYQAARKALRGEPVLTAFVNPRAWDAALKLPDAAAGHAPLPAGLWKSCRWVVASVRLDGGVVLDAVLDYDSGQLPSLLREALERLEGSPELLDRIPKTALLAFAGRFDPAVLRSLINTFQAGDAGKTLRPIRRKAGALLRFDPVDDLLPRLKPGLVLYVVAREAAPAGSIPVQALFAVGLSGTKPGEADWRGQVEAGLGNAQRFATNVHNVNAAKAGGDRPARFASVKSKTDRGLRVHWIDGLADFQPAFGLTPACLVFATAPEVVRQFEAVEKPERLVDVPAFQAWRRTFFADANQILFLNAALLRAHLRRHRDAVLALRVKGGAASRQEAEQELDAALQFLGVVDGAFVAASIGKSQIRLTIGGVTKPPAEGSKSRKAEKSKVESRRGIKEDR